MISVLVCHQVPVILAGIAFVTMAANAIAIRTPS